MSYPTKYTRQYDYVGYQNGNPDRPLPATKVNADLNLLASTSDEVVEFLKTSIRADGALANESVGMDQLDSTVAALVGDAEVIEDLVVASDAAVAAAAAASTSASNAATSAAASNTSAEAADVSADAAASSASAAATSESNAAATLANAMVGVGSSVDSEIMLFNGTGGKTAKRASVSGLLKAASGVLSAAVALTDYFKTSRGSDIASAATLDLDAATGDLIDVTGTTTITAITLADGQQRTVRAAGIFKLTHGSSLVLPGGADIITAVDDFITFRGYAAGVVRCVNYQMRYENEEVATTVTAASPFPLSTGGSGVKWAEVIIPRAGLWEVGGQAGLTKVGSNTPTYQHMHADYNFSGATVIQTAPGGGSTVAQHVTSNNENGWILAYPTVLQRTTGALTVNFCMSVDFTVTGANTCGAWGRIYVRRRGP